MITTCAQLKKNKTLKKAGGSARIAELANEVLSSANIVAYAKIVAEMALRRRLINLGAELSQAGFDDGKEARELMDMAEAEIFRVAGVGGSKNFIHVKDMLAETFERIEKIRQSGAAFQGLPTGLARVDNIISGRRQIGRASCRERV